MLAAPDPVSVDAALVARYFDQLQQAFDLACRRTGRRIERSYSLADNTIRLGFASESLADILTPALDHLPAAAAAPGLEVSCWEGDATGIPLPPLPWPPSSPLPPGARYRPTSNPDFQILTTPEGDAVMIQRTNPEQAFFWVRRATDLPRYHYGSPLLAIFAAWTHRRRLILAHAACVGTDRAAGLLVGKGGSGKSTTSLLCARAGLRYLSDDYCVIQPGAPPTVCSLYNTGKLVRDKLPEFPDLAGFAHAPGTDAYDKPVIAMHRVPGVVVETRLPLRAILVPVITGRPATLLERTSDAKALRALAPSTIFQLHNTDPVFFRAMAEIVRRTPCFRLELGTDYSSIPRVIRALLESL